MLFETSKTFRGTGYRLDLITCELNMLFVLMQMDSKYLRYQMMTCSIEQLIN